ncbi:AsmA family protein [Algiphilus sp.]|uniref:AsmA family protein n=1 Tax=Algiphilus sp. TaxID=1872431 RepID=UPI0025B7B817|nr:AsmA family protein [Algiphilus sp.]MCK5769345.1 AsmA family protein [Algiphilus sp.]
MAKFLKIAAIVIAVIILLLIGALATAAALFDPNDYRDEIAGAVEQQTGRSFAIEGDLSLSIFPWLAVGAEGMTLGNAEGFGDEAFAEVAEVSAGIELLPVLLRREIVLDEITLKGLRLNLAVDAQGRSNWADLAERSSEQAEQPPAESEEPIAEKGGTSIRSLDVSGISIEDAALSYRDAAAGTEHRISDLDLSTGRIQPGKPVMVNFKARYDGTQPAVGAEMQLSGVVDADIATMSAEITQIALNIVAEGDAIPNGKQVVEFTGSADYNGEEGRLSLPDGRVQAAGLTADLVLDGTGLAGGTPSFTGTFATREFSPRAVAEVLAIELPETRDSGVLDKAKLDLRFNAGTSSAEIPELTLRFDDTEVTGNAAVRDFATQRIGFQVDVDRIDVDRYMPPEAQVSEQTGEDSEPSGDINDIRIPVELLEQINAEGSIRIGELIAQGMTMRDVTLRVDAPRGKTKTQRLTAQLYGGNIDLTSSVTPGRTPRYTTRFDLASVAGGNLLSDFLGRDLVEGLANMQVDIATSGETVGDLRSALNGTLSVRLTDGAVKGFDIARTIRNARARLSGEAVKATDEKLKTDFASLVAGARIENGVLRISELDGRNPLFRLLGDGTVDLSAEKLDVLARPSIVRTLKGQEGADLAELAGIEIPIRITGSWADPKIGIDLKAALQQQATGKLREAADERKDELRGKVEAEERRLQEKIDKELGEAAGDALRNLFGRPERNPKKEEPKQQQPEAGSGSEQQPAAGSDADADADTEGTTEPGAADSP